MTLSGHVFRFEVTSVAAGRPSGVYAATDPAEIAILDGAVQGRRGVSSITAEEYEEALKKKAPKQPNSSVSQPRVVRIPTLPELPLNGKGADAQSVRPSARAPTPEETAFTGDTHTTPTIASLLRVRKLNPPKPFAESDAKMVKASKRADRARVRVARGSVSNQ